jgi:hypothetical protein
VREEDYLHVLSVYLLGVLNLQLPYIFVFIYPLWVMDVNEIK